MGPAPPPPRLARWLLARLLPRGPSREGLPGDLEELYTARASAGPRLAADLWFVRETILIALHARALSAQSRVLTAPTAALSGPGPAHQLSEAGREVRICEDCAAIRLSRARPYSR